MYCKFCKGDHNRDMRCAGRVAAELSGQVSHMQAGNTEYLRGFADGYAAAMRERDAEERDVVKAFARGVASEHNRPAGTLSLVPVGRFPNQESPDGSGESAGG